MTKENKSKKKEETKQIGFYIKTNLIDMYKKKCTEQGLGMQKAIVIALGDFIGMTNTNKVKLTALTQKEIEELSVECFDMKMYSFQLSSQFKEKVDEYCELKGMYHSGLCRLVIRHELGLN